MHQDSIHTYIRIFFNQHFYFTRRRFYPHQPSSGQAVWSQVSTLLWAFFFVKSSLLLSTAYSNSWEVFTLSDLLDNKPWSQVGVVPFPPSVVQKKRDAGHKKINEDRSLHHHPKKIYRRDAVTAQSQPPRFSEEGATVFSKNSAHIVCLQQQMLEVLLNHTQPTPSPAK